jgi:hypothetical protein
MDVVGHCLRALDSYDKASHRRLPDGVVLAIAEGLESHVPGVPLAVQLGAPLDFDSSKHNARLWLLRHATGSLVTKLAAFSLEARSAGQLVKLFAASREVSPAAVDEAASVDSPEAQRFDRLPWPNKLEALRTACSVIADAELLDLESRVLSINRARNCLEHRGGLVTEMDEEKSETPHGLRVKWVMPAVTRKGAQGREESVKPMDHIRDGIRVDLRASRERVFTRGEALLFSAEDFVGFCWTLSQYGQLFCTRLTESARVLAPGAFG